MDRLDTISAQDISPSMHSVVTIARKMLEISPSNRPTAAQVESQLYVSILKGYADDALNRFNVLPSSTKFIVEWSRFFSWLVCQDTK
jgi:serine/threonine protein kinase